MPLAIREEMGAGGDWMYAVFVRTIGLKADVQQIANAMKKIKSGGKKTYYNVNLNAKLFRDLAATYGMLGGKGMSWEGGYLHQELEKLGEKEKQRSARRYEATIGNRASEFYNDKSIKAYIESDLYYEVEATDRGMVLVCANKKTLDEWTKDWRDKYDGKDTAEFWRDGNVPDYLNSGIGYWRWQEFGSGPAQHWLKTTRGTPGGNVPARHIFLRTQGEAHEASKRLLDETARAIIDDYGKRLIKTIKSPSAALQGVL